MLALVDHMRVADDPAAILLAKNRRQTHSRHHSASKNRRKNVPRPHRRQLCRIPDKHQPHFLRQCLPKGGHQADIHHRTFIHDHRIAGKRVVPISGKHDLHARLGQFCPQQSVDRRGLCAGQLAHALGRTSGRRRQQGPEAHPPVELQHAAQRRGLAGPRPAGHGENGMAGRRTQNLALLLGIVNALFPLAGVHELFQIRQGPLRLTGQAGEMGSRRTFRPVHIGQIAGVLACDCLADQALLGRHVLNDRADLFRVDAQLLCRRGQQFSVRDKAVAVLFVVLQDKADTCPDAIRVRVCDAQFFRQTVCRGKGCLNPVHGQQIGVFLQHVDRPVAEEAVEPDRIFRQHTAFIQKQNQLFQVDLAAVLLRDRLRPAAADSLDLGQPFRLFFDDEKRPVSEFRDNLPGQGRSDPLHGAGGQIEKSSPASFRLFPDGRFDLKLPSVAGTVHPVPVGCQGLARPGIGNRPGNYPVCPVLVLNLQNRVSVFVILIDHAADGTA